MISLRKFWSQGPGSTEELLRIIRLLLQGIALHAVEGDRQDYEKFRGDMQRFLAEVDASPSPAVMLITTGSALKALEDYNHRTTRYVRMQGAELQNMIGMLTKTVTTLGRGSDQSMTRLREIETQIERASIIEDVRLLKIRMEECLEGIRDEAQRQHTESSRTIEGLKNEILQSQERIRTASENPTLDPATGLPSRLDAEAALAELIKNSRPSYVAVFVVDRVDLINSRFGYAVGDRIMRIYIQELRSKLSSADRLYRWSGPAVVALLHRPDRIERVREQLGFAVPAKMEKTIELTNRTALLPISATWAVFPVVPPLEELMQQLDGFISAHWKSEF